MHGNLEPEELVLDKKPKEPQNFTVYSKVGCPYCTKIVEVLELMEAKYTVYTLDQDFVRASFYGEFGNGTTFPQILLNGKKLGGCNESVRYLRENKLI